MGDVATTINTLAEIGCRNVIHNAYRWIVTDAVASGTLPSSYARFMQQTPPLPDYDHAYITEVRWLRQMMNEAFARESNRSPARLDLTRFRELADEMGVEVNPYADPSAAMIEDAASLDHEEAISVITELCDRLRSQRNASFREIRTEGDRLMKQLRDKHPALYPVMPNLILAIELRREAQMNRDATVIAVAISAHRHSNGGWPKSIDDALASFEPKPYYRNYYGHDFVYKIVNDEPLLYTVGPNGIDDGGHGFRFGSRNTDRAAVLDDLLFLLPVDWPVEEMR